MHDDPKADTDNKTGDNETLGGRLTLLRASALQGPQRELYDHLLTSEIRWAQGSGFEAELPDGRLIGPFNVALYTPEMSRAFFAWGSAQTQHTSLSNEVRQVVILTVGSAWRAAYEVYAHEAVGRKAGLSDRSVADIVAGRDPGGLSPEAFTAYRFTHALVTKQAVSDELYEETHSTFGEQKLVEMVHLTGQYLAVSALLNAFRVPAPRSAQGDKP